MASPIASIIVTADLQPEIQAVYLTKFIKEVSAIDWEIYEKYGMKEVLPSGMYGDSAITGDTGGDAARNANLITSTLDGFKLQGWDDIDYWMNYGSTVDGINDADYDADALFDYNQVDFQIDEGTAYDNGADYRKYDKQLTNKFYVNVPIVRFGATNKYDTLSYNLLPSKDTEMLMTQFGKQAKAVMTQYVRGTLLNLARPGVGTTITTSVDGVVGTDEEKAGFVATLNSIKSQLKKKGGEKFAGVINASDKVSTQGVRKGYIAIIHSDMENFIQSIDGFIDVVEYGSNDGVLPNEFGTIKGTEIRFVTNNVLARNSARSTISIADELDANGNLLEYNMLVMAKDAYTIATVENEDKYRLYVQDSGQGQDVLHLDKLCGWKSVMGCTVHRPSYIINEAITFVTATP